MKRLNLKENRPFKRGDTRHDGMVFREYTKEVKRNGFFKEIWVKPEKLQNKRSGDLKTKQAKRPKNPTRLPYGHAHLFKGNPKAVQFYKKLATKPPEEIDWDWGIPAEMLFLKQFFVS